MRISKILLIYILIWNWVPFFNQLYLFQTLSILFNYSLPVYLHSHFFSLLMPIFFMFTIILVVFRFRLFNHSRLIFFGSFSSNIFRCQFFFTQYIFSLPSIFSVVVHGFHFATVFVLATEFQKGHPFIEPIFNDIHNGMHSPFFYFFFFFHQSL